jgi:hypothetical protein
MKLDLDKIRRQVENELCPEHHKHPRAWLKGNSVKIAACCDNFQMHLENMIEKEMTNQADKASDDDLEIISMN